jgi:hypothetical protein
MASINGTDEARAKEGKNPKEGENGEAAKITR